VTPLDRSLTNCALGTGLFLGIGSAFAKAGPLSVLLIYSFTGVAVFAMMQCLDEMATRLPLSGAIPQYRHRYVDPAIGFTVSWNSWYQSVITLCAEISAAAIVIVSGMTKSIELPGYPEHRRILIRISSDLSLCHPGDRSSFDWDDPSRVAEATSFSPDDAAFTAPWNLQHAAETSMVRFPAMLLASIYFPEYPVTSRSVSSRWAEMSKVATVSKQCISS